MGRPAKGSTKAYSIIPKNRSNPNYARVARLLSNDDLRDELRLGRGDAGYQEALREEAKVRKIS